MMILKNIIVGGVPSDILIDGNKIDSVVKSGTMMCDDPGAEVVDCTGKVALPGFVNMHTHAAMTMMRGMGEDIAFHEWLKPIWKSNLESMPNMYTMRRRLHVLR